MSRPAAAGVRARMCATCGGASSGGWQCTTCLEQLLADVAAIPRTIADLRISYARQDRHARLASRRPAGSSTTSTPWSEPAAAVLAELADLLGRWDLDIGYTRPYASSLSTRQLETARQLRLRAVVLDPRSPQLASALHEVLAAAERVVDIPVDDTLWPFGACGHRGCPERLWAPADAATLTCPRCQTLHTDGQARKSWLAEVAADRLVTASLAGAWLAARHGGDAVRHAANVRKWAERGRIQAREAAAAEDDDHDGQEPLHDARSAVLYRLGDVEELHVGALARLRLKARRNAEASTRRTPR